MIYPPQGRIQFTRSLVPGSPLAAYRLRFAFATDAVTFLAVLHFDLDAVLERAVVAEATTGSALTWNAYLYDSDGADVFGSTMTGLSRNATTEALLVANLGADRRGRIEVMGRHELVIDGNAASAHGLLDLYCLDPRSME